MKRALVLVGHLRTLHLNYPFIKEWVLDKKDTDVYIETYDTYGYWYPDMTLGFNPNSEPVDVELIKTQYGDNLKHVSIEKYDDVRPMIEEQAIKYEKTKVIYNDQPSGASRPANLISIWYKRNKIMNYINSLDVKYDRIILTRPDLRIQSEIGAYNPLLELCNSYNDQARGFADVFFNGSQEQITKLADVYNHMEETIAENYPYCGHSLMKWWLTIRNNIPFDVVNYKLNLYNTPTGCWTI